MPRKTRSDKREDRINTSTKYFLYSFLTGLSVFLYFYMNPITVYKTRSVGCIEEIVCRPEIVKEYVYGGCLPTNGK